jgi:hypothetical protein
MVRVRNVARVVAEWRARIASAGVTKLRHEDCKLRTQVGYRTTHEHDSSGRGYKVWHVGVVPHLTRRTSRSKTLPPWMRSNSGALAEPGR